VDGEFVVNTPTTIQLESGPTVVSAKKGGSLSERTLHVAAGSTITLTAMLQYRQWRHTGAVSAF
jgi:hypothetical protein